jgi:hypothetical protein
VYQRVLAEHALALDERLVVIGDFEAGSGGVAVRTLLDERGIAATEIDAIRTTRWRSAPSRRCRRASSGSRATWPWSASTTSKTRAS